MAAARALAGGGNRAETLRAYELGVAPAPEIEAIVKGLRATRGGGARRI
jgi:hypothetical protein